MDVHTINFVADISFFDIHFSSFSVHHLPPKLCHLLSRVVRHHTLSAVHVIGLPSPASSPSISEMQQSRFCNVPRFVFQELKLRSRSQWRCQELPIQRLDQGNRTSESKYLCSGGKTIHSFATSHSTSCWRTSACLERTIAIILAKKFMNFAKRNLYYLCVWQGV